MHKIMVRSLPPQCRLTAIFDVSQVNNVMAWQHTNDCPQSCHSGTALGLSRFDAFDFLIMTSPYRRSSLYCMYALLPD
jgi:hypothetical protein